MIGAIRFQFRLFGVWAWLCCAAAYGAPSHAVLPRTESFEVSLVAESEQPWSDVAISEEGRLFVCYPRAEKALPSAVAELHADGRFLPFPNRQWNAFDADRNAADQFVSIEAVFANQRGQLWILDAGNAGVGQLAPDTAKLVAVNLETNNIAEVIRFGAPSVSAESQLSDLCVDAERGFAYISDSGAGGLLVVDLSSGMTRKILAEHPSARWERTALIIAGVPWMVEGRVPQRHAHALALSPDHQFLYYQALSSRTLYRLPTAMLRNFDLPEAEIAAAVEQVARVGAMGGMAFDRHGNLYFSALETAAILRLTTEGGLESVAADPDHFVWLDSLQFAADGSLYVTTPERLFRLKMRHLPPLPESHNNRRRQDSK